MKYTITLLLSLSLLAVSAQTHKEAKALLEKCKTTTESLDNYKIDFKNSITSPARDESKPATTRSMTGTIHVKGDAYRLLMNEVIYINDTKHMYIIDPDLEEVDKMEVDEESILTPTSILSEFNKNYSYKLGDKKVVDEKNIQYIILKPNGASEISQAIVGVDVNTNLLYSYEMTGVNKVITKIVVTNFETNLTVKANMFQFSPNEWDGYEIND